jgi:hypothetical protein
MLVFLAYDPQKNLIYMRGRFGPPAEGDCRSTLSPGASGFGKTFEELKLIQVIETDPVTQEVIAITPRPPRLENSLPFPDYLRKK